MAGLLESLGRTNALPVTMQNTMGMLKDIKEMKQADVEAPLRMGLLQNQVAASQQQLEINKFNMDKAQTEQREFNKPMPVEMFRPMFQYPEQYEHALNVARMNGLVNSEDPNDIHIIYGKLPEVGKLLNNDENRVSMATLGKNAAVRQKNTLAQQIMEYENQAGGKDLSTDKKYMELTGAYQKTVEGYQRATETYNMVTAEQQYKLAQIRGKDKPDTPNTPTNIDEFEMVTGIPATMRGTSEYRKQYEEWLKMRHPGAGGGQIVVMPTAEGLVAIDKRTNQVTLLGVNKPLTEGMVTTQQQIGTMEDTFDRVKKIYKPEYVGPVGGRAGGIRSLTIGNPEERATFYAALADVNNSLVYLKSGKQINEQEYERLKYAMPYKNLADSDFEARLVEFDRVLDSIITERQKGMGGYGVTSPKFKILKVE